MAHSLETRVPYLDQALVEFLMRVPPSVKFKNHQSKYLLKGAMKGLLPKEVTARRKAGWHVPLAPWFRYKLRQYLKERFAEDSSLFFDIFERTAIQRLLEEHSQGKANHSFKIWGLLILQEWFRFYQPRVAGEVPFDVKV